MEDMHIFDESNNVELIVGDEVKLADKLKAERTKKKLKKRELPQYIAKLIKKHKEEGLFKLAEYETKLEDIELLRSEGFNIESKSERQSFRPGENEECKVWFISW